MKINWKVRLKNPVFITSMAALVLSFVYAVLAMFDIVPKVTQDSILQLVQLVLTVLGAIGVVTDPTTDGVSDSDRALTYGTENDVRNEESEEKSNG